jgi:hypothetical protein
VGLRWVCLLQVHAPEAGARRFAVAAQHQSAGLVVDVESVFVDDCVAVRITELAKTE